MTFYDIKSSTHIYHMSNSSQKMESEKRSSGKKPMVLEFLLALLLSLIFVAGSISLFGDNIVSLFNAAVDAYANADMSKPEPVKTKHAPVNKSARDKKN